MSIEKRKFSERSVDDRKARLCVDFSEKSSFEAIQILRKAGFTISTTPVSGLMEPELNWGSGTYRGVSEIKDFVNSIAGTSALE